MVQTFTQGSINYASWVLSGFAPLTSSSGANAAVKLIGYFDLSSYVPTPPPLDAPFTTNGFYLYSFYDFYESAQLTSG